MSSSFPKFSEDEIILRHGSQDSRFIFHDSSITLTTANPVTFYFHVIVLLSGFIFLLKFKMTLTFFGNLFREPEFSGTIFRDVP